MSLSERLRVADAARQTSSRAANPVIDLSQPAAPVLDLTDATMKPTATVLCPRCGGPTHVDLFDQVHQTLSLSCTECFHMFRVEPTT
jgi:hypothetical protein